MSLICIIKRFQLVSADCGDHTISTVIAALITLLAGGLTQSMEETKSERKLQWFDDSNDDRYKQSRHIQKLKTLRRLHKSLNHPPLSHTFSYLSVYICRYIPVSVSINGRLFTKLHGGGSWSCFRNSITPSEECTMTTRVYLGMPLQ